MQEGQKEKERKREGETERTERETICRGRTRWTEIDRQT